MPRDWDAAYETGDTPWDKGYAAPPLAEYLEKEKIRGTVLVPGCGAGHDVRLLASQGAQVTGLDIAPGALAKAGAFKATGEEHYILGDFLHLPESLPGVFDWVFEHTCLCALEPVQRPAYVSSVVDALKPGGHLLAVFFREVSNYSGDGPPHPISAKEIDALFSGSFAFIERQVPRKTYPGRPVGSEEICLLQKL